MGITDKLLYNWKAKFEAEQSSASLNADESQSQSILRMAKLGLVVTQPVAYKVTTTRKHNAGDDCKQT
ncbi:hypothetical protein OAP14_10640 [Aliiglaciecola sp.]|nr:hypothetical protein [Aliiglaciecola sp.]